MKKVSIEQLRRDPAVVLWRVKPDGTREAWRHMPETAFQSLKASFAQRFKIFAPYIDQMCEADYMNMCIDLPPEEGHFEVTREPRAFVERLPQPPPYRGEVITKFSYDRVREEDVREYYESQGIQIDSKE